jgi:putative transposase
MFDEPTRESRCLWRAVDQEARVIQRFVTGTRDAARQDVFDYIEMFYNPKRKHTNNGMLSPVDFEVRRQKLNQAGV